MCDAVNKGAIGTTPLRKSRPPKIKSLDSDELKKFLEVTAYSAADQFNLSSIKERIDDLRGQFVFQRLPEVTDAILFTSKLSSDASRIFVFDYGSVVFWNLPLDKRSEILKILTKETSEKHSLKSVNDLESESMDYVIDSSASKSRVNERGEITLTSPEDVKQNKASSKQGNNNNQQKKPSLELEQYSVSHAMSLSVKLANWESSLDDFADSIAFVAESMASGSKLNITKTQVFQKTGELFKLRHHINLGSNLLDTPDFYWDREDLEVLFKNTCASLSLGKRARLMNEKLTYCYELMQLLTSHLDQEHNTKLEWMIIILITVEVLFEIVHFIDK